MMQLQSDALDIMHVHLHDSAPPVCRTAYPHLPAISLASHPANTHIHTHPGLTPTLSDQLTANEYSEGGGISTHVDTHSGFEDGIVSVSLCADTVIDFRYAPLSRLGLPARLRRYRVARLNGCAVHDVVPALCIGGACAHVPFRPSHTTHPRLCSPDTATAAMCPSSSRVCPCSS